jgi:hypothetical protein
MIERTTMEEIAWRLQYFQMMREIRQSHPETIDEINASSISKLFKNELKELIEKL